MKRLSLVATLFLVLAQPGAAQNLTFGMILYHKHQYTKALKHFEPLAEQGNAKAQFYLGLMYDIGQGLPQDYVKSFFWWQKAARQGIAPAQHNLGVMYKKGQSVPQNDAVSVIWCRKAAAQGIVPSQHDPGVAFDNGKGLTQDKFLAYGWLSFAATNGDDLAAENQAKLSKLMTPADLSKAQTMVSRCQQNPMLCLRP